MIPVIAGGMELSGFCQNGISGKRLALRLGQAANVGRYWRFVRSAEFATSCRQVDVDMDVQAATQHDGKDCQSGSHGHKPNYQHTSPPVS